MSRGCHKTKIINVEQVDDYASDVKSTPPFLSDVEKARLIGVRAEQLDHNAPTTISNNKLLKIQRSGSYITSLMLATMEFNDGVLPLAIVRILPSGVEEYWKLKDFIH